MKERKVVIGSLAQLESGAREFLSLIGEAKVIAFFGAMGAGKTTFIKALCRELGVEEEVTSPTFNLINEYRNEGGELLYHFDFYRIEKLQEAIDIGIDEYLYSGYYSFMEWPEKIEPLLPEEALKVSLEEQEDGSRVLKWVESIVV